MKRDTLLFALDDLEKLGIAVPPEAYELAQHADVASLQETEVMEAALFFCDWGQKEQRARDRRSVSRRLQHRSSH